MTTHSAVEGDVVELAMNPRGNRKADDDGEAGVSDFWFLAAVIFLDKSLGTSFVEVNVSTVARRSVHRNSGQGKRQTVAHSGKELERKIS